MLKIKDFDLLALLNLMENVTTSLDNKKCTDGVFMDLMKPFDTVDHYILYHIYYIIYISIASIFFL